MGKEEILTNNDLPQRGVYNHMPIIIKRRRGYSRYVCMLPDGTYEELHRDQFRTEQEIRG